MFGFLHEWESHVRVFTIFATRARINSFTAQHTQDCAAPEIFVDKSTEKRVADTISA